jgi:hypothetical protein
MTSHNYFNFLWPTNPIFIKTTNVLFEMTQLRMLNYFRLYIGLHFFRMVGSNNFDEIEIQKYFFLIKFPKPQNSNKECIFSRNKQLETDFFFFFQFSPLSKTEV